MDKDIEIYICTENGTFISQPFNIWAYRSEYFINAAQEVLNVVVIDFIYRLIKAKKFRKNKIIDVYFNTVDKDTGEIEPLLSYTEYHSKFPDININPCIYGNAPYESLFNLLLDGDKTVHKKCSTKNITCFYEPVYDKIDTGFEYRLDFGDYIRYLGNKTDLIIIGLDILEPSGKDYINQINNFIEGLPSWKSMRQ